MTHVVRPVIFIAMETTYYAVCNSEGPISVRIVAKDPSSAKLCFEQSDREEWMMTRRTDAETDLHISGHGLSESKFAELLASIGCKEIEDLDAVYNFYLSETCHIQNGWYLWQAPS